jgi:hypothetical protein
MGPAPVVATVTTPLVAATTLYAVTCPAANQTAISGGYVLGAETTPPVVTEDRQDPANPRIWIIRFSVSPTTVGAGTSAEAVCVSPGPPV